MATEPRTTAMVEQQIADRIDPTLARGMEMQPLNGGAAFVPQNVGQMMEMAKMMATARIGVRQHLRNNPGTCLAICMQAARWEMDPYAVANKSYAVNDQIAYESQLITAVINTRAPIQGRLKTRFIGEGANRRCIASAVFRGESDPTEVESPPIGQISPKNSPLWKSDPDQQLAYYTKRLWARRECPEVLLGVYDLEEAQAMRDVTPAQVPAPDAPARPKPEDFAAKVRDQATDVDPETGEVLEVEETAASEEVETAPDEGEEDAKGDDGIAGLEPKWQEWVAEREATIAAVTGLGDLAEIQEGMKLLYQADPSVPTLARQLVSTAIIRKQQALAGASGRGRR